MKNYRKSILGILFAINFLYLLSNIIITIFAMYFSGHLMKLSDRRDRLDELIEKIDTAAADDYSEIDAKKYLGENGYIEILDENFDVIYSGTGDYSRQYTPGIMRFTSNADENTSYMIEEQLSDDGGTNFVISEYRYTDGEDREYSFNDSVRSGTVVLDGDYRIIYSSMNIEKAGRHLSEAEINALFDNDDDSFSVRHTIKSSDNGIRYLIAHLDYGTNPRKVFLKRLVEASVISCIVFLIAVDFLLSLLFVRKLKNYLRSLSDRMSSLADGETESWDEFNGFKEFRDFVAVIDETGNKIREKNAAYENLIADKRNHTSGFIHDIVNSLSTVLSSVEELRKSNGSEEEIDEFLSIILHGTKDSADLAKMLSTFNKADSPDFRLNMEYSDLGEIFRGFLDSAEGEFRHAGFDIEKNLSDEPLIGSFDAGQMMRVFYNFKFNFIKYCERDATIYFAIYRHGNTAVIDIGNNGTPIEKSIRKDIFKPYIKGKNASPGGIGTGLGLALADKIISMHKGTIELLPEDKGKYGNLFRIRLPIERD